MAIPGPALLIFGPLLLGVVLALIRRWPVVSTAGGAIAAILMGLLLANLDPEAVLRVGGLGFGGDEWTILGRVLLLTAGLKGLFLLLYTAVALLCLVAALIAPSGTIAATSLLALSPLAVALMIRPYSFGGVALVLAVAIVAVAVQGERLGEGLAATRYLVVMVVALLVLMVAEMLLNQQQLAFVTLIDRTLMVGLIILLAGFPLHIWVTPLFSRGSPWSSPLALSLTLTVAMVWVATFLEASRLQPANLPFMQILRYSAVILLAVGGGLAIMAANHRRLLAYVALVDMGAFILALTMGSRFELALLLPLLGSRFLSLLLAGAGLALLDARLASPAGETSAAAHSKGDPAGWSGNPVAGLARRVPLAVALFSLGLLSLAGIPPGLGYLGRWATIMMVAGESNWLGLVLVAAMAAVLGGWLRHLRLWLAGGEASEDPALVNGNHGGQAVAPLSRVEQVTAGALLVIGLFFALVPQPLWAALSDVAQALQAAGTG